MLIGRNNRIRIIRLCFSFPGIGNVYKCIPFLCTPLSLQELHLFCGDFCPSEFATLLNTIIYLLLFCKKYQNLLAHTCYLSFCVSYTVHILSHRGRKFFYICQRGKYKVNCFQCFCCVRIFFVRTNN